MKPINAKKEVIRQLMAENLGITHGRLVFLTGWAPNTVTKYMEAIRAESQAKDAGQ